MAIRFSIPKSAFLVRILKSRWGKIALASGVFLFTGSLMALVYSYVSYSRIIDEKLKA